MPFIIVLFILLSVQTVRGQELGFGCLGLVGGFGGYTSQGVHTDELNNFVQQYNIAKSDSLLRGMEKFGNLKGFRLGLNFLRQNVKGMILTFKGFYENLLERRTAVVFSTSGQENNFTELALKNFGLGIDIGTELTRALSWKIIDASVVFSQVRMSTSLQNEAGFIVYDVYSAESAPIGVTLGTGFIFELIDDYVSLEGSAGYMFIETRKMKTTEGKYLTITQDSDEIMLYMISSGGFNASIQLNIGVAF